MPTTEQIEAECMKDYRIYEDKYLLATYIRIFVDDNTEDFYSPKPVRVRVVSNQRESDIINWIDDWCDSYWDVELAEPNPELEKASSLYVDGISRNINGEVERPTGWRPDPNQGRLTGKQALDMPAVLTTRDREAADAAGQTVLHSDKHTDEVDIRCPHCGELVSLTIKKTHETQNTSYDVQGYIGPEGGSLHIMVDKCHIAVLDSSLFGEGLYLNRVNVPEKHRGRGIGSALMEKFKESSRHAGHKYVIVEPGGYDPNDQQRRIKWYEKHGFVKQEEGFYLLDLKNTLDIHS